MFRVVAAVANNTLVIAYADDIVILGESSADRIASIRKPLEFSQKSGTTRRAVSSRREQNKIYRGWTEKYERLSICF